MLGHGKILSWPTAAAGTAFQRHGFEVAVGIVPPLMIDAVVALLAATGLPQRLMIVACMLKVNAVEESPLAISRMAKQ